MFPYNQKPALVSVAPHNTCDIITAGTVTYTDVVYGFQTLAASVLTFTDSLGHTNTSVTIAAGIYINLNITSITVTSGGVIVYK